MFALFPVMTIIGVLIILPGWLWARKQRTQNPVILLVPVVGTAFWFGLTAMGIGPQSLANIVEVFYVFIASIILPYIKFFILDRSLQHRSRGIYYVFLAILILTLGLRLLMPQIPE